MRVLAVDPGPTTGLAYWNDQALVGGADGSPFFKGTQLPADEAVDVCLGWIEDAGRYVGDDDLIVVCEEFVISVATAKKGRQGNTSIEIIGVLRHACRRAGVRFETQKPSDALPFATNDKLRAAGFWVKGKDHARDAARHLLTWLVERGAVPPRDLGLL